MNKTRTVDGVECRYPNIWFHNKYEARKMEEAESKLYRDLDDDVKIIVRKRYNISYAIHEN